MQSGTCWECASVGEIHNHHPVPRSRGGTKTIPLCLGCHAKAHHRDKRMAASALTRATLAAKAARGERVSGHVPMGTTLAEDGTLERDDREAQAIALVKRLRSEGMSLRAIARRLHDEGFEPRGRAWYPSTVRSMVAA